MSRRVSFSPVLTFDSSDPSSAATKRRRFGTLRRLFAFMGAAFGVASLLLALILQLAKASANGDCTAALIEFEDPPLGTMKFWIPPGDANASGATGRHRAEMQRAFSDVTIYNAASASIRWPFVNLTSVCTALQGSIGHVGFNGLLKQDDELEDGILLELGAVGGFYHLLGALLARHAMSLDGPCGPLSWTIRLLAQDGPAKGFAPLHAAVWEVILAAMQPPAEAHLWQTVGRICPPLVDRDGAALLLHCVHGAGHASQLAALAEIDGIPHDPCMPPRACSLPLSLASLHRGAEICEAAPSAGPALVCATGSFMTWLEASSPDALAAFGRGPRAWAKLCSAFGALSGACFWRVFTAGVDSSVQRDDAGMTNLTIVRALSHGKEPSEADWLEATGVCAGLPDQSAEAGCVFGLASTLHSGFAPVAARRNAMVDLCEHLAWRPYSGLRRSGEPTAPVAHVIACVAGAALSQLLSATPPDVSPEKTIDEAAVASAIKTAEEDCTPLLDEALFLEPQQREATMKVCAASLSLCHGHPAETIFRPRGSDAEECFFGAAAQALTFPPSPRP